MLEQPQFLQGIFSFQGHGLDSPQPFSTPLVYTVPFDKRSQFIYFRAGNSSSELIYIVLLKGGKPMRYFPIGAKESVHVPLAVVEDLEPETTVELQVGAPAGTSGLVVLDIGMMEF
jgi:hypothetical protein